MKTQTVIISGASTGLGYAMAALFLARGHNVVLNSVNPENLEHAVSGLGAPERVAAFAGDVQQRAVGEKLVSLARQRFGRLDTLINNAGIFAPKPFLDVTEADLDQFLGTNLKGTYFTTQAAIPAMLRTGGGSIINIGTVLVDHAIGGFPATAPISSKGAIHALTRQLAAEFGPQNIRVNAIAPGIIRTPIQGKIGVESADSLASLHLLNRVGEPEHVAEAAYLLATNDFITGEILNVDGGHVAGHKFG